MNDILVYAFFLLLFLPSCIGLVQLFGPALWDHIKDSFNSHEK